MWAEYRNRQFRSRERTRAPLYCTGSQWISKIDDDVAMRSAAADQRIALGWRLHGLRPLIDRAKDEPSLTRVGTPLRHTPARAHCTPKQVRGRSRRLGFSGHSGHCAQRRAASRCRLLCAARLCAGLHRRILADCLGFGPRYSACAPVAPATVEPANSLARSLINSWLIFAGRLGPASSR